MAYGEFYVEHQGWARWPKTLIMCRKRGYETIERRRYVPELTCDAIFDINYYIGINGVCEGLRCSSCGNPLSAKFKYCPWCGAKVVGE